MKPQSSLATVVICGLDMNMFLDESMSFFDGVKPTFKNVQQYSAVHMPGKSSPIAMFETDSLGRTFITLMTDGEQDYTVKPFRFVAEKQ